MRNVAEVLRKAGVRGEAPLPNSIMSASGRGYHGRTRQYAWVSENGSTAHYSGSHWELPKQFILDLSLMQGQPVILYLNPAGLDQVISVEINAKYVPQGVIEGEIVTFPSSSGFGIVYGEPEGREISVRLDNLLPDNGYWMLPGQEIDFTIKHIPGSGLRAVNLEFILGELEGEIIRVEATETLIAGTNGSSYTFYGFGHRNDRNNALAPGKKVRFDSDDRFTGGAINFAVKK